METLEKKRILLIEDELNIARGIELNLGLAGYEVCLAQDGIQGIEQWRSWKPDLIVLDIMLPMVDGFSVLKTIRKEDEKIPVLILSARGDTRDKVRGLEEGVDDYMSKPFDLEEFLLRVRRLLQRGSWSDQRNREHGDDSSEQIFTDDSYSFGSNSIDFTTATAQCVCGNITLTEQEISLLKVFIGNSGKPLSRQVLLHRAWGYVNDTTTRTVDNFIVRFRKYFEENPKKPVFFKSRRSVGYIFDPLPNNKG